MAGAGGRSGAERYKATCHPRLGGACEAIGLVRVAQAGVAGAALARDGKAGAMPPGLQPDQELIPAGAGWRHPASSRTQNEDTG